ncbi:MAG TPA: hypothetical protein VF310_16020, partial [Vicinamibacteria bacterium]
MVIRARATLVLLTLTLAWGCHKIVEELPARPTVVAPLPPAIPVVVVPVPVPSPGPGGPTDPAPAPSSAPGQPAPPPSNPTPPSGGSCSLPASGGQDCPRT